MANELSQKIVDFAKNGVAVIGKGKLAVAVAAAAATSVTLAMAYNGPTADAAAPSREASAAMAASIQQHLDDTIPGVGITVVDLGSEMSSSEQIAARGDFDCVVYAALRPTTEVMGISELRDASEESFSRFMTYTDVATCLGAETPEQAKAFGLMMSATTTKSEDFPRMMAAYSEMQELRNVHDAGDFWSPTAWAVVESLDTPKTQALIADGDVLGVFGLAHELQREQNIGLTESFAVGFREAMLSENHFVQVEGGIMDVHVVNWLNLVRDDVEPVARFLDLFDYMHASDGDWKIQPADIDFHETLASLEALGLRGDSSARGIAKRMGSMVDFDYEPYVKVEQGFSTADLNGTLYEVVPQGLFVVYDAAQRGFAISDADRRPIAAGFAPGPAPFGEQVKGDLLTLSKEKLHLLTPTEERTITAMR